MSNTQQHKPPKCYTRRCFAYAIWWHVLNSVFVILGSASVTCAAIAALEGSSRKWAVAAAVLTAVMGFLKPKKHYFNLKTAWGILDQAIIKYRNGMSDLTELHAALEKAENLIIETEQTID